MKTTVFFYMILFFSLNAIAQSISSKEIITLKNGLTYTGVIIEQFPGKEITFLEVPTFEKYSISFKDIYSIETIINNLEEEKPLTKLLLPSFMLNLRLSIGKGWNQYSKDVLVSSIGTDLLQLKSCHIGIEATHLKERSLALQPSDYKLYWGPQELLLIGLSLSYHNQLYKSRWDIPVHFTIGGAFNSSNAVSDPDKTVVGSFHGANYLSYRDGYFTKLGISPSFEIAPRIRITTMLNVFMYYTGTDEHFEEGVLKNKMDKYGFSSMLVGVNYRFK